jgi:hypothetical protein
MLACPSPVPATPGIYAWYFPPPPFAVDTGGYVEVDGWRLLYVGISPKPPPANGTPASRQQLRSRLRQHYRGNAAGSTLRLTLGSVLAAQLGLRLRRVGSGRRLTFADGEPILSGWRGSHARVCWMAHPRPWELEQALVARLDLPLNLHGNNQHRFYRQVRAIRAQAKATARASRSGQCRCHLDTVRDRSRQGRCPPRDHAMPPQAQVRRGGRGPARAGGGHAWWDGPHPGRGDQGPPADRGAAAGCGQPGTRRPARHRRGCRAAAPPPRPAPGSPAEPGPCRRR